MSKELELFEQIIKGYTETFNMAIHHPKDTIVKWEGVEEIEKSLKALKIIKETRVDINFIKLSKNYDDYCSMEVIKILNNIATTKQRGITEKEYDLLKEIFK